MSDAEDRERKKELEIQEVEHDLVTGHLDEANKHLREAQTLSANPGDIRRLKTALREMTTLQRRRTRAAPWAGFGICALGYLVLAIQQPDGWGIWVWRVLALLLVPAVCGLVVGKMMGPDSHGHWRFQGSMKAGAWAMGLYTLITLIVLRGRIGSGPSSGDTFLIVAFVTAAHAIAAGLVAGASGKWLAYRTR